MHQLPFDIKIDKTEFSMLVSTQQQIMEQINYIQGATKSNKSTLIIGLSNTALLKITSTD